MRHIWIALFIAPLIWLTHPAIAKPQTLTPEAPIQIPGGSGHFDFIQFDAGLHRVLACHPGAKSLAVLDTKTGKITQVQTGSVNGVGIDPVDNRYFAAGADQTVSVVDRTTLAKIADIPLTGPGDDVLYNPTNGLIYVDNDDGTQVWVIDPKTNKITGTIAIAGAPEVMAYDAKTDLLYQSIKPTDQIQALDLKTNTVVATWSTLPAHSPHGLALDVKRGRLYSAGKNNKLAAIDIKSGKVVSSCDIAAGVDEIAFDPGTSTVYCGCGSGFVSIVEASKKGITHIADVPTVKGAKSITVDPTTHDVWIAYSDEKDSYLQRLDPGDR